MSTDPRGRKALPPLVWMCVAGWLVLLAWPAAAAFDAGAAFNTRCSGCHSVGKGVVVGPDLRGVTERHDAPWLHRFIRSSQSVIQSGDSAAVTLYQKYRKRMPDHPLTDAEIDAILAFIKAGGPREAPGEYRLAREATAAEVARGYRLFTGAVPLANGGAACIRCHDAGGAAGWQSGTLASDLTYAYTRYQDGGLTRALTESRLPLMADYRERPLTRDETFVLKAFLYQVSRASLPEGQVASAGGALFAPLAWLSQLTRWFSGRTE
jgi:mono/diheme cytochrome c family protein